jgi:hypothetical protein
MIYNLFVLRLVDTGLSYTPVFAGRAPAVSDVFGSYCPGRYAAVAWMHDILISGRLSARYF